MGRASTDQLEHEIKQADQVNDFIVNIEDNKQEYTLAEYLDILLTKYNLKKKDVITASNIDMVYGYQIFQGRKNPTRDILLSLCVGFGLDVDDARHLLYYGNAGTLYPRNKRDAYIMFALNKKMNILDLNKLLYDMDEETL